MTTQTLSRVAVVTGASAGLGASYARHLAARGHDLVLVARRADRLAALATELAPRNVQFVSADLATESGRDALWQHLDTHSIVPELFVNNAGLGANAPAWTIEPKRVTEMIRLNVEALTVLSLEAVRRMLAAGGGGLLNIASTAGFQAVPYMAVYGATKGYDLLFTEGLAHELFGTSVRVMAVCPGYTLTEFQEVATMQGTPPKLFVATADECVSRSLRAFDRGEIVYIDHWANRALNVMQRLIPRAIVNRASATLTRPK